MRAALSFAVEERHAINTINIVTITTLQNTQAVLLELVHPRNIERNFSMNELIATEIISAGYENTGIVPK